MKLILNESQYSRLFNKQKRKLVITESQYNKLILEGVTFPFGKIKVGDIAKLISSNSDKLHFRVVSKDYNYIIMINCNDGVHKNAYFFIDANALDNGDLHYVVAQNKDIDKDKPLESLKKGRKGAFKNIKELEFYDDGQKKGCNLSDEAKKIFTLDVNKGMIKEPEEDEGGEVEDEEGGSGEWTSDEIAREINGWKSNKPYVFELDDGSKINILLGEKGAGTVPFKIMSLDGSEAKRYEDILGEIVVFDGGKSSVDAKVLNKNSRKFDLKVKLYTGGEDESGTQKSEDRVIYGIVDFGESGINVDDEDTSEVSELSDEEIGDLIEKLVTNSDILNDAIATKPNHVLELLKISRKKGIIPINDRMKKWYNSAVDGADESIASKRFPYNSIVRTTFEKFKVENEELGGVINLNRVFSSKSMKRDSSKYHKFKTNFSQNIRPEENLEYIIYLKRELENTDDFYIYEVDLFYKPKNDSQVIGSGEMKILKDKTKVEK